MQVNTELMDRTLMTCKVIGGCRTDEQKETRQSGSNLFLFFIYFLLSPQQLVISRAFK